jgi:hypothetical protein
LLLSSPKEPETSNGIDNGEINPLGYSICPKMNEQKNKKNKKMQLLFFMR